MSRLAGWFLVLVVAGVAVGAASAAGAVTERVSVSSAGEAGNDSSWSGAISADGRFVAFASSASNLVSDDTNWSMDVFVRDRATGVTERVSVSSAEEQTEVESGDSGNWIAISANGRFVAFDSGAPNLVAGDRHWGGVYLRDRAKGVTVRISESPKGVPGNGGGGPVAMSPDGHFVAFASSSSNLVRGDTNRATDVFVWNRLTDVIHRVSVSSTGKQANSNSGRAPVAISADGRLVAFESRANNLVPGDTNYERDIFVHNRSSGRTRRMNISSMGIQADRGSWGGPAMSADGRLVVFVSDASNLVSGGGAIGHERVFAHNRITGRTRLVDVSSAGVRANYYSLGPAISADGRFVAFSSEATNLVPHDTNGISDVFVRDRTTRQTRRVSVSSTGQQANDYSGGVAISADGHVVAFSSYASNLVPDDTPTPDVFVRVRR